MKDITISSKMQALGFLGVLGGVGALVAHMLPEIRRYLKIESM